VATGHNLQDDELHTENQFTRCIIYIEESVTLLYMSQTDRHTDRNFPLPTAKYTSEIIAQKH